MFACGTGCSEAHQLVEAAGPDVTTSSVTFLTTRGDETFAVEVADNPQELSRGLMYRKSLLPHTGMLFVFPDEREHFFWMKNTYVSLDMIFMDGTPRVVGVIADTEPLSTESLTVGKPSKYVVEVNAGTAAETGIIEGTVARLQIAPEH